MTVAELAVVYELQLALEAFQAEAVSAMEKGAEPPAERQRRFAGLRLVCAKADDALEQLDDLGLKA